MNSDLAAENNALAKLPIFCNKRYAQAVSALKDAIEVKPNSEQALMGLAMSYIVSGNRDAAKELLPRLKELDADLALILEKSLGVVK